MLSSLFLICLQSNNRAFDYNLARAVQLSTRVPLTDRTSENGRMLGTLSSDISERNKVMGVELYVSSMLSKTYAVEEYDLQDMFMPYGKAGAKKYEVLRRQGTLVLIFTYNDVIEDGYRRMERRVVSVNKKRLLEVLIEAYTDPNTRPAAARRAIEAESRLIGKSLTWK